VIGLADGSGEAPGEKLFRPKLRTKAFSSTSRRRARPRLKRLSVFFRVISERFPSGGCLYFFQCRSRQDSRSSIGLRDFNERQVGP
jgi:hypothetical protein